MAGYPEPETVAGSVDAANQQTLRAASSSWLIESLGCVAVACKRHAPSIGTRLECSI